MKTTVQRLDLLVQDLQTTVQVCATSTSKRDVMPSLSASITNLDQTIAYLKEAEKRHFTSARKAFSAIRNSMSGMLDGLSSGDLALRDFRKANQRIVNKFIPMVMAGLLEESEQRQAAEASSDEAPLRDVPVSEGTRSKIKIVISKTAEMREAVEVVSTGSSYGIAVNGDLSELDALAQHARATLPVRIPGNFQVARVPIVPIFPTPSLNRTEVLKRLGFKHSMIEGFVVLHDQILLNISKQRAAKASSQPLALAHSVVDLLNERGSTKYEIVSDTPNANPRNTDLLMFWILPRQRMAGLMKALGASNTPAVVKWGLPLPSEKAESEKAKIARLRDQEEREERERQETLERLAAEREAAAKAKQEAKRAARERHAQEQRQANQVKKQESNRNVTPATNPAQKPAKTTPKTPQKPAQKPAKPAANTPLAKKLEALVQKNQADRGIKR